MQAALIHSCLHSVMAMLPEPEEGDSHQEVSAALRWPCPRVGGHSRTGSFSCSSPCTWTPCRPSRTC